MAMYFCSRCEILRDADHCVCSPDPKDPLGLICENCMPECSDEQDISSKVDKAMREADKDMYGFLDDKAEKLKEQTKESIRKYHENQK